MKKLLLLMLVFMLFKMGAISNGIRPVTIISAKAMPMTVPINEKLDSINGRVHELNQLLKQL